MIKCQDCKDTGKITLLTSTIDCDCNHSSPDNDLGGPQDFPDDSNLINGWYSPSKAKERGTVVYLHAVTGEEVEITEISWKPTPCAKPPDLKFVGIVDKDKYVSGGIL